MTLLLLKQTKNYTHHNIVIHDNTPICVCISVQFIILLRPPPWIPKNFGTNRMQYVWKPNLVSLWNIFSSIIIKYSFSSWNKHRIIFEYRNINYNLNKYLLGETIRRRNGMIAPDRASTSLVRDRPSKWAALLPDRLCARPMRSTAQCRKSKSAVMTFILLKIFGTV